MAAEALRTPSNRQKKAARPEATAKSWRPLTALKSSNAWMKPTTMVAKAPTAMRHQYVDDFREAARNSRVAINSIHGLDTALEIFAREIF